MEENKKVNGARVSSLNHSRRGKASSGFSYPPSASRVPKTEPRGLHSRLDKAQTKIMKIGEKAIKFYKAIQAHVCATKTNKNISTHGLLRGAAASARNIRQKNKKGIRPRSRSDKIKNDGGGNDHPS